MSIYHFWLDQAFNNQSPLNLTNIIHPFLPILIEVDLRTILITDTITKSNIYNLVDHTSIISWINIDPSGLHLASYSWDHTVRIWDLDTGFCIKILQTDNEVRAISWNKSGSLIALGSDDKNINVWKTVTHKLPQKPYKTLVGHKKGILALVSNHSYDLLASSSEDKSIRIWKWLTGECIRWFSGYSFPISILETTETQLFGYESNQYNYLSEGIRDFEYYGIGSSKRLKSGEYNYIWSWSNINSGLGYMCESIRKDSEIGARIERLAVDWTRPAVELDLDEIIKKNTYNKYPDNSKILNTTLYSDFIDLFTSYTYYSYRYYSSFSRFLHDFGNEWYIECDDRTKKKFPKFLYKEYTNFREMPLIQTLINEIINIMSKNISDLDSFEYFKNFLFEIVVTIEEIWVNRIKETLNKPKNKTHLRLLKKIQEKRIEYSYRSELEPQV